MYVAPTDSPDRVSDCKAPVALTDPIKYKDVLNRIIFGRLIEMLGNVFTGYCVRETVGGNVASEINKDGAVDIILGLGNGAWEGVEGYEVYMDGVSVLPGVGIVDGLILATDNGCNDGSCEGDNIT